MTEEEITAVLADYELGEYICFLVEYIEALLHGYAVEDDARFAFDEFYFPDHPAMHVAKELMANH